MQEGFSEAAMEPISEITQIRKKSLADSAILSRAIVDSFRKLKPRTMAKNPVMFVVEVGAVVTTFQLIWNALHYAEHFGFGLQITLWLWFTVLFANFAEAMAEGRGKAQADTLRKARAETQAHRLRSDGSTETVSVPSCTPATLSSLRLESSSPATAK
jgi:potassium-transporting ATPase ATP-binding subunit